MAEEKHCVQNRGLVLVCWGDCAIFAKYEEHKTDAVWCMHSSDPACMQLASAAPESSRTSGWSWHSAAASFTRPSSSAPSYLVLCLQSNFCLKKKKTTNGEFTRLTQWKNVIYLCAVAVYEIKWTELLQKHEHILRCGGSLWPDHGHLGWGVLLGSSPAPLWGVLQGLWKKGAILEQGLVSLCFLCLLGGSAGLFAVICLVLCCREDVRLGPEACPCWKNCGADRVRTRVPLVVIHVYNFFLKSKCLMGLWEESVCYCLHEVWFFFGLLGPELLDSALILVDSGLYL